MRLKKRLGLLTPPVIMPYRGYGVPGKVHISGHILDDRLLYESEKTDKARKNFLAMLSRYISDGLADIRVKIKIAEDEIIVNTDEDGLFEATLHPKEVSHGWNPVRFQVLDNIVEDEEPLAAQSEAFIETGNSEYMVISDVDDTILISHATQVLRKMRLILTKNSKTRLPFPGVSSFYRALNRGSAGNANNPIFFVSSSEWNLYDLLDDFCRARGIPKGVFLLQELKTSLWKLIKSGGGTHRHKADKVRHLMKTYPDKNFVLIGDSGQKDAYLYEKISHEFPKRILAIYIRDIGLEKKARKIKNIVDSAMERAIEMILVGDTEEAKKHAKKNGFII